MTKIADPSLIKELKTFPNQAIIWSIINGPNKGQLIQLPEGNSAILLENSPEPYAFIVGNPNEKALSEAIKFLKYDSAVYCNPIYHNWFIKVGWEIHLRVQLIYQAPVVKPINKEWFIKPIDNIDFFKQCYWFKTTSERYRTAENFLENSIGYALCNASGAIISEAYLDYLGNNYAEIGIVTNPHYRQLGAASQVASHLVEECVSKGITPIWSCNAANLASLKTALSLGFRIDQYYVQMILGDEASPIIDENRAFFNDKAKLIGEENGQDSSPLLGE